MKYISYTLIGISGLLAILAFVLLLKKEAVLRDKLLDTLEGARTAKLDKRLNNVKESIKKETDDSTEKKG